MLIDVTGQTTGKCW